MRHLPSGSPRTAPRSELPRRTFHVNHRVVCLCRQSRPKPRTPHGETSVQMLHFPQSRSKDDNLVDVKS
jgi:hypothetical protein